MTSFEDNGAWKGRERWLHGAELYAELEEVSLREVKAVMRIREVRNTSSNDDHLQAHGDDKTCRIRITLAIVKCMRKNLFLDFHSGQDIVRVHQSHESIPLKRRHQNRLSRKQCVVIVVRRQAHNADAR